MNYLIVMPEMTKIKEQSYTFPIGVAYVAASLKQTGINVKSLNLTYKEGTLFEILDRHIKKYNIDIIAVGGLTSYYLQIKEILTCARKSNPSIITMVGGGIITSDPEPAMEALEIADIGMIGEGEITICELAEEIEKNGMSSSLSNIDGIIYKENGEYVITNQRAEIMDLDNIPFPDYEGFDFDELLTKTPTDIFALGGGRFGTVSFGRSCPFNCTFCFHTSGSKYRQRSLDSLFKEIDMLVEKYDIKNIYVSDELFAYKDDRIEEFCERIYEYGIGFIISLRVDIVTGKLIKLLKDHGCLTILFGLESADNRILKSMKKAITIEQIDKALNITNKMGLNARGSFIFGDLEETYETAINTINWKMSHPEYQIKFAWIIVYPGSYLYKVACEKGVIKDRVQYIKDGCPYVNVSKMSSDECSQIAVKLDSTEFEKSTMLVNVSIKLNYFGTVTITGKCDKCKHVNIIENVDVFRTSTNAFCDNCKNVLNILVSDYIDGVFNNNIEKIVIKNKVALWPVTNAVSNMYKASKALNSENVYLIDSSELKQQNKFLEKTIYSPEIIKNEDIKIVVLTLSSITANDITDIIKIKFPEVKHIIYAGELIDKNFSLI